MMSSLRTMTPHATTKISPLSLHYALPICRLAAAGFADQAKRLARPQADRHVLHRPQRMTVGAIGLVQSLDLQHRRRRSEEHTSELQSHVNLVCRLLLEKKKRDSDYIYFNK